MLEGRSCMISRALPTSCEQESKWYCMTFPIDVPRGKRRLEDEGEEVVLGKRKPSKHLEDHEMEDAVNHITIDFFSSPDNRYDVRGHNCNQENTCNNINLSVEARLYTCEKEEMIPSLLELRLSPSNTHVKEELTRNLLDLRLSPFSIHDQELADGVKVDIKGKRPLEGKGLEELGERKSSKRVDMTLSFHDLRLSPVEQSHKQCNNQYQTNTEQSAQHDHDGGEVDTSSLIQPLGRDISINCLLRCSRSVYNSIAPLNRSFRKLIQEGEIYRLRRQMGIIEHWVYFSCDVLEWEAFDPIHRRWMRLPKMPSNECFRWSDKESLAVSTELLVFGKEITSHVIWKYSILTNSWSSGMKMNNPRCLFGSASLGEIAIVAGGCDSQGKVLNTAELYNSETGTWETLPSMHKPRKMCSGVFMDGKFYVIGGSNLEFLNCGEEYDLKTKKWREIENMFPRRNGPTEAPPLVAVVKNELYLADYVEKEVKKYDKGNGSWITVGELPKQAVSTNGWGLAFRACGDQLIVIGGPRAMGEGTIELNSWAPKEGQPQWNLLARKQSGSFVYNCAVMGC